MHEILNQCKANQLLIPKIEHKSPFRDHNNKNNLVDSKSPDGIEGALYNNLNNSLNNKNGSFPKNESIEANLYDNILNNEQNNLNYSNNFGDNSSSFQPEILNYSR